MPAALDGRVALITGSASGQGREAAVRFASEGAAIAVADVDEAGSAETVRRAVEAGLAGGSIEDFTGRRRAPRCRCRGSASSSPPAETTSNAHTAWSKP